MRINPRLCRTSEAHPSASPPTVFSIGLPRTRAIDRQRVEGYDYILAAL